MYGWAHRRVALADLIAFAWSAPMRDLATRMQMSDVGLKKLLSPSPFWLDDIDPLARITPAVPVARGGGPDRRTNSFNCYGRTSIGDRRAC